MKKSKFKNVMFVVLIIVAIISAYLVYCKIYDAPWNLQGMANRSYIDGYNDMVADYDENLTYKNELCFIRGERYCFGVFECENGSFAVASFRVDKNNPPKYYCYSYIPNDRELGNDFFSHGWEIYEKNKDIEFACYFSKTEKQNMKYKDKKAESKKLEMSDGSTFYMYYVITEK